MTDSKPVIALLGAGIFARDAYVPIFKACKHKWTLGAVWSRSADAVEAIRPAIAEINDQAKLLSGDDGLEAVLADPTITCLVLCLPVQAMLELTQRALALGKHVLQEKPVALTVEEAIPAIKAYRADPKPPVWGIAENYRSEFVFRRVKELVDSLGHVFKIDLVADFPIKAANKYYNSAWRRDCPGGFVTDTAVHYIAAARTLAHAAGWGEVQEVSARTHVANPGLPPPDSVVAHLQFEKGGLCGVSITYASHFMRLSVCVVGTLGTVEVRRGGFLGGNSPYTIHYNRASDAVTVSEDLDFSGIEDEVDAFLALVAAKAAGQPPPADEAYRVAPEEGARDLAVVEAMLESAAGGAKVIKVQQV